MGTSSAIGSRASYRLLKPREHGSSSFPSTNAPHVLLPTRQASRGINQSISLRAQNHPANQAPLVSPLTPFPPVSQAFPRLSVLKMVTGFLGKRSRPVAKGWTFSRACRAGQRNRASTVRGQKWRTLTFVLIVLEVCSLSTSATHMGGSVGLKLNPFQLVSKMKSPEGHSGKHTGATHQKNLDGGVLPHPPGTTHTHATIKSPIIDSKSPQHIRKGQGQDGTRTNSGEGVWGPEHKGNYQLGATANNSHEPSVLAKNRWKKWKDKKLTVCRDDLVTPIIVFVNKKSGNGKGKQILDAAPPWNVDSLDGHTSSQYCFLVVYTSIQEMNEFKEVLKEAVQFSEAVGGASPWPTPGEAIERWSTPRLLIVGGDGTIGPALDGARKAGCLENQFIAAALALGTGNDFVRSTREAKVLVAENLISNHEKKKDILFQHMKFVPRLVLQDYFVVTWNGNLYTSEKTKETRQKKQPKKRKLKISWLRKTKEAAPSKRKSSLGEGKKRNETMDQSGKKEGELSSAGSAEAHSQAGITTDDSEWETIRPADHSMEVDRGAKEGVKEGTQEGLQQEPSQPYKRFERNEITFTCYASIGLPGLVGSLFEPKRKKTAFLNKVEYGRATLKAALKGSPKINDYLEEIVTEDGSGHQHVVVSTKSGDPHQLRDAKELTLLNIETIMGGFKMYKTTKKSAFLDEKKNSHPKASPGDGLLEVLTTENIIALGLGRITKKSHSRFAGQLQPPAKIKLKKEKKWVYMQFDGEYVKTQDMTELNISHPYKALIVGFSNEKEFEEEKQRFESAVSL